MCIIIVKNKGVSIPSDKILKECFNNNPDGAGVSYNLRDRLIIKKGFATFKEFANAVHLIPKESSAILHCRISTSGGICKELTHPYLLTRDENKLRTTHIVRKEGMAVAHNGVFSGFTTKPGCNDTMQYIKTILTPLSNLTKSTILNNEFKPIIDRTLGGTNKLAIVNSKGNVCIYGSGWITDKETGLVFSNESYKPRTYKTYSNYSGYSNYGTCSSYNNYGTTQSVYNGKKWLNNYSYYDDDYDNSYYKTDCKKINSEREDYEEWWKKDHDYIKFCNKYNKEVKK